MRKVDSILRAINRRMKEVGEFFPKQSEEYQQIQAVLGAIPGISTLKIFPKGKPAQLSRSKKVIKKIEESPMLYAQLNQALDIILSYGTVKQMAQRYIDSGLVQGFSSIADAHDSIRQSAKEIYKGKYNDNDTYNKFLGMEDEASKSDDEKYERELKGIRKKFESEPGKNNPIGMDEKYNEILRRMEEAKENHLIRTQIAAGIIDEEESDESEIDVEYDDDDDYDMSFGG